MNQPTLLQQQARVLRRMAEDPTRLWHADELLPLIVLYDDRDGHLRHVMDDLCRPRYAKVPGVSLPVATCAPVLHIQNEFRDHYFLATETEYILEFAEKLEAARDDADTAFA